MSPAGSSKRRRRSGIPVLPDVILKEDHLGELGEPRVVIAEVEARTARSKDNRGYSRARANELHREADRLYYKGDYESALALYHRAARLYPHEATHAVAARRTEAAINSATNPPQELARLLREARSPAQVPAVLCPEAAAHRARAIVGEAADPLRQIPEILKFFDARKDFWRLPGASAPHAGAKRQLSKCVRSAVRELERAHEAGAVHELGKELVNLVSLTDAPSRNLVAACGYLAEKHVAMGRHDRAVDMAARMVFLARSSADSDSLVRALVAFGRAHVAFGHLDALAKLWERLVGDIHAEEVAQAWLYHDLGRCHLELGNLSRALEASERSLELASEVKSRKWTLRGQLLRGQVLLKFGRFVEAVCALRVAGRLAEEDAGRGEGGTGELLAYVQSLVEQVTRLLRRLNEERDRRADESRRAVVTGGLGGGELLFVDSIAKTEKDEEEEEEKRDAGDVVPANDGPSQPRAEEEAAEHQPEAARSNANSVVEGKAEDKEDNDRLDQLLAKTRALSRARSPPARRDKLQVVPPRAPSLSSIGDGSSDSEEEVAHTARTRTLRRRTRWFEDSARTRGSFDINAFDCADEYDDGLQEAPDMTEDEVAEETKDGDPEPFANYSATRQELLRYCSDGTNIVLDNDTSEASPDGTSEQKYSPITDYLKSLETTGFEDVLSQ